MQALARLLWNVLLGILSDLCKRGLSVPVFSYFENRNLLAKSITRCSFSHIECTLTNSRIHDTESTEIPNVPKINGLCSLV
jgi:hypothetical protein